MISASNFDLRAVTEAYGGRSEAGAYRLQQIEVPERGEDKYVENFDGIMRELDSNYGWPGAQISEWLGRRAATMSSPDTTGVTRRSGSLVAIASRMARSSARFENKASA